MSTPWMLIWAVFAIMPQTGQPYVRAIPEKPRFQTEAKCLDWGAEMSERMEDWVRGHISADWDHDVQLRYKCQMDGRPA